MFKNNLRKLTITVLIIFIITACETSIDIIKEGPSQPVVYCILNKDDSIHYVRLEKSFSGAKNALNMAKIADSIYYKSANVRLDFYSEGFKYHSIILEPSTEIIKDKGIFSSNYHVVYKTTERLPGTDISLIVEIPDLKDIVYANTKMINKSRFINPRMYMTQIGLFYEQPFEIEFIGGGPYNELGIQVYYTDNKNGIIENKMVEIIKTATLKPNSSGFNYLLREENFLRPLSRAINTDSSVILRKLKQIDLVAYSADQEFLYFKELFQTTNDLNHLPYSNIVNGYGLLTNRSTAYKTGFTLTRRSLDSLANGRYTRQLKFRQ